MRKTLNFFKFQSNLSIRGPKKKAEASSEMNKDYINIFKDKPDITIKPLDQYPLWLTEKIGNQQVPEQYMTAWMNGDEKHYMKPENVGTFMHNTKRRQIQNQNFMRSYENYNGGKINQGRLVLNDPIRGRNIKAEGIETQEEGKEDKKEDKKEEKKEDGKEDKKSEKAD